MIEVNSVIQNNVIKLFTGEKLFECGEVESPLIEGFLWPRDVIMLLGSEKAGKSILAMQMASCLTSGEKFLDIYDCQRTPVLYIQTEGKREEFARRLKNINNSIPVFNDDFYHVYKKQLPIDNAEFNHELKKIIAQLPKVPKVMFIDSLYSSMEGDLNDNKATRKFIGMVAQLTEARHMAVVIIHHEKKENFNSSLGESVKHDGDKGAYGSIFLRAWVDHIIFLRMNRDKTRTLSCSTQRSGTIEMNHDLVLVEPDPLCFQIKGDYAACTEIVKGALKINGQMLKEDIIKKTGLSLSSIDKALRQLKKDKLVDYSSSYPREFYII